MKIKKNFFVFFISSQTIDSGLCSLPYHSVGIFDCFYTKLTIVKSKSVTIWKLKEKKTFSIIFLFIFCFDELKKKDDIVKICYQQLPRIHPSVSSLKYVPSGQVRWRLLSSPSQWKYEWQSIGSRNNPDFTQWNIPPGGPIPGGPGFIPPPDTQSPFLKNWPTGQRYKDGNKIKVGEFPISAMQM